MTDHTPHQRKIIDRYYAHRDDIMLGKLADLVSELYLADTDTKRAALWKRVAAAMKNLKVPPAISKHILDSRDPQILATHLADWTRK
jgi:hypothetical protein